MNIDAASGENPFRAAWLSEITLSHLPASSKMAGWVPVLRGFGESVSVPLMVARGVTSGPTILAVAGVHGNEYEGMEAIRRVFAELDPSHLQGTFAAIPVANPFAFEARTRATPDAIDGINLARTFPGNAGGTPTQALAHQLLDFVVRNVGQDDLFIDIHSGSHDVAYATIVGVRAVDGPGRAASEQAARHFGIPDLWLIPDSSGPFNAETSRRGIPTIGTETLGRAGCDADGVAAFATGLRRMLRLYGVLTDAAPHPQVETDFRPTFDLKAPCSGIIQDPARLYQNVSAGDLLCTIVDVFGAVVEEIVAPASGTVWAARSTPAVHAGELLFTIALNRERPDARSSETRKRSR